jgi:hypothetical protein
VPLLSSSQKNQLDQVCEKAASGNVAGATAALHKVCVQIVKKTLPSGSAQTEALKACNTGTGATSSAGTTTTTTPAIPTGGAGLTAAVLKAACKSYQQYAKALPGNISGSLASACQKVDSGDIAGAKAELKQVCESVAKLLPSGSQQATVAADCNKL